MRPIKLLSLLLLVTVAGNQVFAQKASEPIIYLRAKVDHLRLRARPDKNAPVITELAENDQLMYLGESGGPTEQVTLRGVVHNARWYKVAPSQEVAKSGWVYGGAVALSSIFLPEGAGPAEIQEDFLEIRKVNKNDFEKGLAAAKTSLLVDTLDHRISNDAFQLTFDNGVKRIVRDTVNTDYDGEGDVTYEYRGQFAAIGQYVVYVEGSEWAVTQFIDKRNGKVLESIGFPSGLPILSADKRWVALGFGDPYENMGGLQIFLADGTGIFQAFTIQQEEMNAGRYWAAANGELYFSWESIFSEKESPGQYFRMKIIEP